MQILFCSLFHLFYLLFKLAKSDGAKSLATENLVLRQQLLVLARRYKRAPKLNSLESLLFAIPALFIKPCRILKTAIIIKPATLLKFHKVLVERKYHLLYSKKRSQKPGPKGPSKEVIQLVITMKQRNPRFGARRIAMQISNTFGIPINKDVVLRILAKHSIPSGSNNGPSWLTFIGHMKDSLWSIDFFSAESIPIKSYWIMIVMDQFTRRIMGFATHGGDLNGVTICCMFNKIIACKQPPTHLSSDNDPLFQFYQWKANLRILEIKEIKTIPSVPCSHPFIERLIGTIRREYLDHVLFWNEHDLQEKLHQFQDLYNRHRSHHSLAGKTPLQHAKEQVNNLINLNSFRWQSYCHNLFQLPAAA